MAPFPRWKGRFLFPKTGLKKICLEVFAMKTQTTARTKRMVTLAMLAAIAIVLVAVVHFPLLPAAPFLEYDPADIPIFIGMFLFGPWAGLQLTVVVSLIQGLTVSAASSWIGIVMHILATGSFCVLAGLIYRQRHTRGGAALALAVGTLTQTLVMVGCNLVFTPLFMGAPVGEVVAMLVPAIIPFNLMKAALNSLVTFVIYKPISRVVRIEGEPLTAAPKCQEK